MNTEPRKWRQAAPVLLTVVCLFCAPGFLRPSALGEDGKKTTRLEKKAQSRQQRAEKRSMKKAEADKPADAATQPDPKSGIEPVERKITSEQVSIAGRKIDALVVANLKKHNQTPAPLADELVLLRRVYLDVVGRIPAQIQFSPFGPHMI